MIGDSSPTAPFEGEPHFEELQSVDADRWLQRFPPDRRGFFLESGLQVAGTGRWHILGIDPLETFEARGQRWTLRRAGGETTEGEADPLDAFEMWWQSWAHHHDSPIPSLPFQGGAVGWIGYEAADRFLGVSSPRKMPTGAVAKLLEDVPDLSWSLYDEVIVIDAEEGRGWFVHRARAGWRDRFQRLQGGGVSSESCTADPSQTKMNTRIIDSSLTDDQYLSAVSEIRRRIGEGDVYEVNLARGWILDPVPSALQLHRIWRRAQPVPYGAMIQGDPFSVVSASPEQFLSRRGDRIATRPIKGTVPRSGDAQQDRAGAERLLADPKERAELAMIVDLQRNDLGKICRPGSVEVVSEAVVESYASVLHTVATIRGELRGDPGPGEILRATFPGGSITGAPKLAAIEQIRTLEPWPRSVYTGSIGWLDPCGDMELSIAIRTALLRGQQALVPFGGAVTWDSQPTSERMELHHKARAMFDAVGIELSD